jgi:hypothetical protein
MAHGSRDCVVTVSVEQLEVNLFVVPVVSVHMVHFEQVSHFKPLVAVTAPTFLAFQEFCLPRSEEDVSKVLIPDQSGRPNS